MALPEERDGIDGAAEPDSAPGTLPAAPDPQMDYARTASSRPPLDEVASTSYHHDPADTTTLLRKFAVHPTSSPRLQGLADLALMALTLIPTALLRLIRAAMGLVGVTEHTWRGISLHVPLSLEDRQQLELTSTNLVAGRLGRRPEAPERGPVPPSHQLLLDVHVILAAASSTASAFGLPFEGMPEAALHAKLSSYLHTVASWEKVCTQDCFKAMRKHGRKTLVALCDAAPRTAAPPPVKHTGTGSSLRPTPSSASMMSRPKPKAVAKVFMSACLMQQGRAHADTLIQLVARLPGGAGDLVETVSLISLAPGAEYLRLLGEERFAEQLEAMAAYGRLRPSDAKKEPEMQGMAINARVHEIGIVRYPPPKLVAGKGAVAEAKAPARAYTADTSDGGVADLPSLLSDGSASERAGTAPGQPAAAAARGGARYGWTSGFGVDSGVERTSGGGADRASGGGKAKDGLLRDGSHAVGMTSMDLEEEEEEERESGEAEALLFKRSVPKQGYTNTYADPDDPALIPALHPTNGSTNGGNAAFPSSQDMSAPRGSASATPLLAKHSTALPHSQQQASTNGASASPLPQHRPSAAGGAAAGASTPSSPLPTQSTQPFSIDGSSGAPLSKVASIHVAASHPSTFPPAAASASVAASSSPTKADRFQLSSDAVPSYSTASAPSTSISQYPTDGLDIFQPLYGCPRSGAFAVHGREPRGVGLSRLMTAYASCHSLPAPSQAALLGALGYSHPEQLREEVELRKALCVAQALPVVVASLRLSCRSPNCLAAAARTGSFMHVQQSLLSDLHRHERAYLEDTKGALDVLADRLMIRFVAGSEKVLPLHISGSTITVSLPSDCVRAEALAAAGLTRDSFCGPDKEYGLTALLFNQGINSLQSLGFIIRGGVEPLQETLNRFGLERLNEYAARAGRAGGPALAELNAHFGPRGVRPPKDTAMFGLVRRACTEVGSGRAVNCKSGKDRTALELCKAFAEEVVASGLLPSGAGPWLEAQFMRGLSYVTTSQNHGQPPAYAFNEMEIATLPSGWRPDWRLCGKVSS